MGVQEEYERIRKAMTPAERDTFDLHCADQVRIEEQIGLLEADRTRSEEAAEYIVKRAKARLT